MGVSPTMPASVTFDLGGGQGKPFGSWAAENDRAAGSSKCFNVNKAVNQSKVATESVFQEPCRCLAFDANIS